MPKPLTDLEELVKAIYLQSRYDYSAVKSLRFTYKGKERNLFEVAFEILPRVTPCIICEGSKYYVSFDGGGSVNGYPDCPICCPDKRKGPKKRKRGKRG